MQTARTKDGERVLVIEGAGESCLVRHPKTGDERSVPTQDLESTDESPLGVIGRSAPRSVREALDSVRDERTLGLLREIRTRGPIGVRTLLDAYGLCESDLHGVVGELRAAGLVEPATLDDPFAGGERGYQATERAHEAFDSVSEPMTERARDRV